MKAWIISNPWDDEGRQALTFADTRNEAKSNAGWITDTNGAFKVAYIEEVVE
ncbi:hypothetical protein [Lactococcus sp. KTH0-1S]|uniref:hypothetical protein n=1 Tax=Lactococcus sp. KTH0-1S TaxID=3438232 RepID=UPI00403D498E